MCSLLQVSFQGVNGNPKDAILPKWPGTSKLKTSLEDSKQVIDKFSSDFATSFQLFNQIVSDAQSVEDSITFHETNFGQLRLRSPNVKSSKMIFPIFLNYYSPITASGKTLNVIFDEYLTNIKPSVNELIQIERNSKQISLLSTQINSVIDSALTEIDNLQLAFDTIDSKMFTNLVLVNDILIDVVFIVFDVSLSLMTVAAGAILIISSIFKWKGVMGLKYLLHVLWNISFFLIALCLVAGAVLGLFGMIGNNIIVAVNYMLDPDFLASPDFIFGFENRTAKHIEVCLNEDGDLTKSMALNKEFFDYIDGVYLRSFTLYELDSKIASITNSKVIPFENEIYLKYQKDFSLSTNASFEVDDYTYSLYQLSRWTDSGLSDSLQPPCVTRTFDYWVDNVNQCPSGYAYSSTGENVKNCLLIPNWAKPDITSRYNSACDSIGGVPIAIGGRQHFDSLKDYHTSCDNLLNSILSGNNDFSNSYKALLVNLKKETENIKPLIDALKTVYESIVGNNSIYQSFNCFSLRTELIVFYDLLSNRFYSYCLIAVIVALIALLIAYAGMYFLIDVIYRHESIVNEREKGFESNEQPNQPSEGTPEYDETPKSSERVENQTPVEKKEEEDFENNPMYNLMTRQRDNALETNVDKRDTVGGQDNKLILNSNLPK